MKVLKQYNIAHSDVSRQLHRYPHTRRSPPPPGPSLPHRYLAAKSCRKDPLVLVVALGHNLVVGAVEFEEPESKDQNFRLSSFLGVEIASASFARIVYCHPGDPETPAYSRLGDLADRPCPGSEIRRRGSSRMILAPNAFSPSSFQTH
jgi:hypothetical protein